jgi:hypothetical protein
MKADWGRGDAAGAIHYTAGDMRRLSDFIAVQYFAHSAHANESRNAGRSRA